MFIFLEIQEYAIFKSFFGVLIVKKLITTI